MIRLERVTKAYGDSLEPAVSELSLDVAPGEVVCLVGPSGCGKTTTLRMVNRLVEPTSGRVLVGGRDVGSVEPHELRRGIGYVIQQVGLSPTARSETTSPPSPTCSGGSARRAMHASPS